MSNNACGFAITLLMSCMNFSRQWPHQAACFYAKEQLYLAHAHGSPMPLPVANLICPRYLCVYIITFVITVGRLEQMCFKLP